MRFENLKVKTRGLTISPIVQEDDLYLRDFGIWQDGELYDTPAKLTSKLVRCFRQVWGAVPDDCRMALKRLWKHDSPRHKQAEPGSGLPHIVINDRWIDEAPFKAACRSGIEFGFSLRWIEWMKPVELRHVIAHELGHAMSYTNSWYDTHFCHVTGGEECLACECQAFSYMASWGFDPFLGDLPKGKRLCDRFYRARKRGFEPLAK